MSTLPAEVPAGERTREPTVRHLYPFHPDYRVSGQPLPQVGDRALCGWRKRIPCTGGVEADCVVCLAMRDRSRGWTAR